MKQARFPLGRIVATPAALLALEEAGQNPGIFLKRHITGDRGEVDDHDRMRTNSRSTVVFASSRPIFFRPEPKSGSSPRPNRSSTTLLLPSEY